MKKTNREGCVESSIEQFKRSALRYTAVSVLAALAMQGGAYAQDNSDEEEQDIIVVRGVKGSQIQNLSIKRNADAFVDAITELEVGKYPDKNLADALQRVPGVSITRTGGEGQFVSIRGTGSELTLTQLNGNYVASGSTIRDPQRSFNYTLVPANLISKTEVFKTPQAKIDEGGLGGTVIIHTRKPLDMDRFSGFLNVEGTYSDTSDKVEPNFGGLVSWKNKSETLGVLVSYTKQDRTAVVESINTENWRLWNSARASEEFVEDSLFDTAGNEIIGYAPFAVVQSQNIEERNRDGYQATLQWRPTDRFEATFNYIGANLEQNNDQNLLLLAEWDYRDPAIVPGSVRLNGDTIVAMQLSDGDLTDTNPDDGSTFLQAPAVGSRRTLAEARSNTYDLELAYDAGSFVATVNGGFTKSEGGPSFDTLQRFFGTGTTTGYGWDLEADTIINADAEVSDFNSYGWTSSDAGQTADEEYYIQGDVSVFKEISIFESFDIGVKYRDHAIKRRLVNIQWDDGDPNNADLWGGCCGLGFSYWHTFDQRPTAAEIPGFVQLSDGLTGKAGTQKSFPTVNWDAYTDWLDSNFTRAPRAEDGFFFNIDEKITAGYVQGNFSTGLLSGNVGVRIVHTQQDTASFTEIAGTRETVLTESSGSTTEILPSLNVKYDLTDDIVLRGAAARVIARVPYAELGRSETFNAPADGSNTSTGSKGNPDLEPFDAWQFDAGAEWYFSEASIIGATFFHKEISSFITEDNVIEMRSVPNRTDPIEVVFNLPVNGRNATSTGVEVFYQQAFDFGGGIITNYTYTDTSEATVDSNGVDVSRPLPGTSKHQVNATLYYETDLFDVRASYNFRSDAAGTPDSGINRFTDGYSQIDLNATLFITEEFSLTASAINVTSEVEETYLGAENRLYARSYAGRRLYFGANYRF